MPIFYPIYAAGGRSVLTEDLCDWRRGESDPFALEPRVILEKVTALGMVPLVDRSQHEPWYVPGLTHRVLDQGNTYLVTISRDAETILVQEERDDDDPYSEAE